MVGTSLVFLIHLMLLWTAAGAQGPTKFKAAVYGHAVILPPPGNATRDQALTYMKRNLDVYRDQAEEARKQGANILVFPEDGIYGFSFTRDSIYNYLENIPQPLKPEWSPCSDPDLHPNTEVLHELSCIAKNNSMYIVANMGDKQPCDVNVDPKCPADGRYQYNTDVAFDPRGTIVAKYHKYHLFFEEQFNTPKAEIVTFQTPFGTFGMMVCFDVLFLEPGVPMVLTNQIANIVFPTAWMDALPLLSAIGFHSSFSRALGVNYLAADIHIPLNRMHGSGIYNPDGMKAFYYGANASSPAKLLVAELDVMDKPRPAIDVLPGGNLFSQVKPDRDWTTRDVDDLEPDEFTSILFADKYTFVNLVNAKDKLRVCQNEICCNLQYDIGENTFGTDLFAFGAFDGLHTHDGQYYFQICTLVRCADSTNRSSCGSVTTVSTTEFRTLQITGEILTPFIYPQIVLSDGNGELLLAKAETWGFKGNSLWTNSTLGKPLLSAALFGRHYGRDQCSHGNSIVVASDRHVVVVLLSAVVGVWICREF